MTQQPSCLPSEGVRDTFRLSRIVVRPSERASDTSNTLTAQLAEIRASPTISHVRTLSAHFACTPPLAFGKMSAGSGVRTRMSIRAVTLLAWFVLGACSPVADGAARPCQASAPRTEAEPIDAADPAPVAHAAQSARPEPEDPTPLTPCRVVLHHKYRDVDVSDDTWKSVEVPVHRFSEGDWGALREVDWLHDPVAPVPYPFEHLLGLSGAEQIELPVAASNDRDRPVKWIQVLLDDEALTYAFDTRGRPVEIDWDPVADSSVYVFRYAYDCKQP